jgi:hypothetical protein
MDTQHKQHAGLENNITAKVDKTVQRDRQTFLQRIITVSFVVLAALIGVRGNLDILSGKSPLDVIPWMITQGVELIIKAQRTEKSIRESDRKSHSDKQ